jgi:hypothetical protein
MNFEEVEKILEEGKFKKAVAGALLGATLASGAMAQDAKVRTRGPARASWYGTNYEVDDTAPPLDLKDTIMHLPERNKSDTLLLYQMTLSTLGNKKSAYLKIQKQYLNKKITREEAVKKLVDGGILNATSAKGQPYFWDDLES